MPALFRLFILGHVWVYRLSGGILGGKMDGRPIILLTTRGRKSGASRTVPVVPFIDGDLMYVIASLGGAPKHPAWYLNLKADPNVGVQLGAKRWQARAVELPSAERDAVWTRIVAAMPGFGEYQKKTTRVIPVVRLDR